MKIAIDISQIIYGTGVSVYTKHLVKNLLEIDKENEYVLFGGSLRRKAELENFVKYLDGNYESKIYNVPPTGLELLWNRLHFPKAEFFTGPIDLFHTSDWTHPPTDAKVITTIHDLFPLKFPNAVSRKVYYAHRAKINRVIDNSDRIIVPSKATKDDVVKIGFPEEKVHVIPEAHGESYKKASQEDINRIKKKYGVSKDYILAVGTGKRKNTERIITAYEKARSENLKLLIAGRRFENYPSRRGVRFLGHVPNEELPILYSGASALVYVSLYEGFGIPILEAMASECPVVTSNISSMPEVAGDAAVLVDPYEVNSIAEGIKEALNKPKTLIRAGKKRIKNYSWKKNAEETLKIYQEVVK